MYLPALINSQKIWQIQQKNPRKCAWGFYIIHNPGVRNYGFQPAIWAMSTQNAFATRILPADTLPKCPPSTSVV